METWTPGSTSWQALLDKAIAVLESARDGVGVPFFWSLGGGTALMLEFSHRTSRDVDIFLHDPQVLTHLSPRLNERAEAIARDHVEASNFVKLTCEQGEIDFIVAPELTGRPHTQREVGSRCIIVERPVEIVVKKAFYRTAELRIRDLFDLAVVIDRQGVELEQNAGVLRPKRDMLMARVETLIPRYVARAAAEIDVLAGGKPYLVRAPDLVREFLGKL